MLFNSLIFSVFLPFAFAGYWMVRRTGVRGQNLFLILASYVFYGWWDVRFLALIVISSTVDFIAGKHLHKASTRKARKRWLWASLFFNLGTLGIFKYYNFFVQSAVDALQQLGLYASPVTLNVLLPVGISFYTFQTLSYTIDIYRDEIEPTDDPIAFFAFVSFFPQLVAGPIERARDLLPQLCRLRSFNPTNAVDGLRQMLWGFTKKVVVADNVAPLVEQAFNHPENFSGVGLFLAACLFSIQLYCDFSGYSDIAIGTARLFGIQLSQNFAFPYYARSVKEFWRRWHISLSTWFRDYVYVPLGGARTTVRRAMRNIMIVFTVSGLWHGAAWTYVCWGGLNGLGTMLPLIRGQRLPKNTVAEGRALPSFCELLSMTKVFLFWTLGLIFFRSANLTFSIEYLHRIVTAPFVSASNSGFTWPLCLGALLLLCEWPSRNQRHGLVIGHWPRWARWSCYGLLILIIVLFGNVESREFVYFQF